MAVQIYKGITYTKGKNDLNGNPRYIIHYIDCRSKEIEAMGTIGPNDYEATIKLMKRIGGKRFNNKSFSGGIIFQSHNIERTIDSIIELSGQAKRVAIRALKDELKNRTVSPFSLKRVLSEKGFGSCKTTITSRGNIFYLAQQDCTFEGENVELEISYLYSTSEDWYIIDVKERD